MAGFRALMFALPPVGRRWSAGLRAAAAVAVPGIALVLAGASASALFVTLGTFAVLYGEGRPYRVRAGVVATAGAGLLAAAALGASVGTVVPPGPVSVLVVSTVAVLATYVVDALRLGPPGPLFFALVCAGAQAAVEAGAQPWVVLGCAAAGVGSSVVVSMAGCWLTGPSRNAALSNVRCGRSTCSSRRSGRRRKLGTLPVLRCRQRGLRCMTRDIRVGARSRISWRCCLPPTGGLRTLRRASPSSCRPGNCRCRDRASDIGCGGRFRCVRMPR
ncbi:hypothetical protein ACFPN7_08095 [Amycolatopsis halotolerans]|uniref:hypothetical protein n=1 Tax=Amycolatopsis halotolerans TaxID=330083 RepID=UPI0036229596